MDWVTALGLHLQGVHQDENELQGILGICEVPHKYHKDSYSGKGQCHEVAENNSHNDFVLVDVLLENWHQGKPDRHWDNGFLGKSDKKNQSCDYVWGLWEAEAVGQKARQVELVAEVGSGD